MLPALSRRFKFGSDPALHSAGVEGRRQSAEPPGQARNKVEFSQIGRVVDEGNCQEYFSHILESAGLRRLERCLAKLVRRGHKGQLEDTSERQGPIQQRKYLWQQPGGF